MNQWDSVFLYAHSDKFQSACVQMGRLNHVACIELLSMCNKLNGFSGVSNYMVVCTAMQASMHCCARQNNMFEKLRNGIRDPHCNNFHVL